MPKTSRPKVSTATGGVEKLPMAPLAAVFGVASGDRGSLAPAELIKNNHSVVGFYLPNTMHRAIQSQRSSSASRETTGKVVPNPPKEAAGGDNEITPPKNLPAEKP